MLQNKTTKQENAIEKYFCEPFDKLQRFPMDKENTGFLMQLLTSKEMKEVSEEEKPFLMKLIEKRVKHGFSYSIKDNKLILFLAIITKTPGTAVMYLTYLQYWCKKHDCKEIDLEKFCSIFPIGFPSEDDLQKIWKEQKVKPIYGGSDNLLDYQSATQSIQFMETAN